MRAVRRRSRCAVAGLVPWSRQIAVASASAYGSSGLRLAAEASARFERWCVAQNAGVNTGRLGEKARKAVRILLPTSDRITGKRSR